jgi:peptide/nickel transport system substrate-binding protein
MVSLERTRFLFMFPRRAALTIAAGIVVVAAAFAPASSARPDVQAGAATPFVVNVAGAPATIDPSETGSDLDNAVALNLYTTLVRYGTTRASNGFTQDSLDFSRIEGYLATRWRATNNFRTWTFTLRRGAVFPDGSPMDAAAVKYTFERLLTRGAVGAYILQANTPGLVTAIEAPNRTTVVIRLKTPYRTYPYALAHTQVGIVNPRVVEAHGGVDKAKPNEWMATHSAGGGPYLLQEYSPRRRAVFVTNPRYFGPKPREPRVIVNFIPSDTTLLLQASSGKAHVTAGLTYQSIASLRGKSCCRIVANDDPAEVFLSLPNLHAPFNNRLFRQALSYAVPYSGIVSRVAYGYAKSYYGPFPPSWTNYNPQLGRTRAYDLDRAKRLIEQSGVRLPVRVDLVIREGANDFAQIATIVKDTWRQLGVEVTVKRVSASAYITARNTPKRKYALINQYGAPIGDPYWTVNYDMRCGSIFNTSDHCNRALDRLMDRAFAAPLGKRQPLWNQFARIWINDAPRIPLYTPQWVVILGKDVRQYHYGPVGTFQLSLWRWGR